MRTFRAQAIETLQHERFSSWALPNPGRKKATEWHVAHQGQTFRIPIRMERVRDPYFPKKIDFLDLVHVFRDPANPNNLMVLRKDEGANPHAGYYLSTVFPEGHEVDIGHGILREHEAGTAKIEGVFVEPFLMEKGAVSPSMERKKKTIESKKKEMEQWRAEIRTRVRNQDWEQGAQGQKRIALLIKKIQAAEVWLGNAYVSLEKPPKDAPCVAYRKIGLGHFLIALRENIAKSRGYTRVLGVLEKGTTGRFLLEHGYQKIDENAYSITAVKDL